MEEYLKQFKGELIVNEAGVKDKIKYYGVKKLGHIKKYYRYELFYLIGYVQLNPSIGI